jgi:hypothetical protein
MLDCGVDAEVTWTRRKWQVDEHDGFMTKRVGRGEKKGEPEVSQQRSIVQHKERSLHCHCVSNDQPYCSKQRECEAIEVRNKWDVEMLSLMSWIMPIARHMKMTLKSLAFIGVAAILVLLSGVKGECVDRVVIALGRPE